MSPCSGWQGVNATKQPRGWSRRPQATTLHSDTQGPDSTDIRRGGDHMWYAIRPPKPVPPSSQIKAVCLKTSFLLRELTFEVQSANTMCFCFRFLIAFW